ncbi:M48 family metallopeptidase [Sphingomonas sp.]|uniref:M48 family metallopeptidase n=1 Tax=Sphingomonas sp. TaxID=28214 RepID=UPI002DD6AB05|nr:M48 family metallopeptidase [Sphingomonas sp.]
MIARRALAAVLAGALGTTAVAQTATPLVAYGPQTAEERGLWMEMEEAERTLTTSDFVVRDPALNAYVNSVLCRTVGADRCGAARIYLVRTPYFNASMAPNGMMQVWTGLLLRARNEAQLAAVLGHEFAHFEQRHSLKGFRDARAKTDAMAWLSFLPYVGLAAQVGMMGGIFANSRDMEREADTIGLSWMAKAGYAPGEFAAVWSQLRDEQDATAAERKRKSRKDRNGGFFATHPNSAERVAYLTADAAKLATPEMDARAAEYRAALAPWWTQLIDDQIKLNDFGATDFLLMRLAEGGWTPELLYARGELYRSRNAGGDMEKAADAYRSAIAAGSTLPEARRGLGLALLRSGDDLNGRAALAEYLKLKPDAGDRAMIAMLAGES